MKTRVLFIISVLAVVVLAGCASSVPGDPGPGDGKDNVTAPDCADEDCGPGDDVDIAVDCGDECEADQGPEPDEVGCQNQCEEGQIECNAEATRYRECGEADNGCLDFTGAQFYCPAKTECVCGADQWCDPGEGEPCACIPDCGTKICGPDGCGGQCPPGCAPDEECVQEDGTCIPGEEVCDQCVDACGEEGDGPNCCLEGQQKCNGVKIISCEDAFPADALCDCWKWVDIEGEDCEDPLKICQDLPDGFGVCLCEFLTCDNGCCPGAVYTACDPQGDCCVPDCEGKECGGDGCGGLCGECPAESICDTDTGECVPECIAQCLSAGDIECAGDFAFKTCVEVQIAGDPCLVWDDEFTYCEPQHVCVNGACVCQPDCLGKNCGDDGCDGSCGECPDGPYWECVDGTCACECDDIWAPVCDEENNETYPNYCEAVCAGITAPEQGPCPDGCTSECTEEEWNTGAICDVDGVTHDSFCELKCADDDYDNDCPDLIGCPLIDYMGECLPPELVYCEGTGCPVDFNPICGDDGNTYYSYCCMSFVAPDVEYFCAGQCVDEATCPDAAMICSPVCGIDGEGAQVSYMNAQVRDCLGGAPAYDAACCDGTPLSQDWVCTDNDGTLESYLNPDVMLCVDPALQLLYDIPQDAYGDYQLAVCDDCECDLSDADEGTWLCGTDFNTYLDQCALNCFAFENPGLSSMPLCGSGCGYMTDECPCPPGIGGVTGTDTPDPDAPSDTGVRGVCGDDGYTYGSICDATYNGVFVVLDAWCDECGDLCTGEDYAPLCCKLPGQDTGATYPNACVVENCSTAYETGDCFSGECCLEDEDCDDAIPQTVDTCNPITFVCDHV